MRWVIPPLLVALAAAAAPRDARARPEFARREEKACGFCHINPRGGGPRNQTGLLYARSEFRFPEAKGDLNSFGNPRQREAMVHARRMIDVQHIPAAVEELHRLARAVKEPAARKLVDDDLHALDVKGEEILGEARLLLRGKGREEGVQLLATLAAEYKGLAVHAKAAADLAELRQDPELRELVRKEEREAKARLLLLDAARQRADGDEAKARKTLEKVVAAHAGTRAAEDAAKELAPPKDGKAE
jgi:hypothetical protein